MRALIIITLLFSQFSIHAQTYDLLITNGRIVDGTGNSWYYGSIAVQNGRIVAVGKVDGAARKTIDAKGMIVAPGFIDVHTHIEGNDLRVPTAPNFIMDGVTSVVTGNCGGSNTEIAKYFKQLDSVRMSINVATLIGHNSVRREVMGEGMRDPSPQEQLDMEAVVEKAMKEGAVGLSTGLIYTPGTYSKTPEVVGLAKAASRFNGVYASHIRDEEDNVTEAVEEAINIGRQATIPVQISHFKVTYKPNWGRSTAVVNQVEEARRSGIDVTVDQYPYIASSTTLNTRLPSWAFSGGTDSLMWRLHHKPTRDKITTQMLSDLKSKKFKDYSYCVVARYGADTTMNGKNISEVNKLRGRKATPADEVETILEMVEKGSASMVFFSMDENDLRTIMQYPFNMFASDAGIVKFGSGMPHPRAYGTNSRVLGKYVREMKIVRLEEAIRRMTSLPAQKFQLHDRGILKPGFAADIVVFDEKTVADLSTFQKPHAYATGFNCVIVNGQVTVENGAHTGARGGTPLKGSGAAK